MAEHVCGQMPAEATAREQWPGAQMIVIRCGAWTNTLTCVHDRLAVRDELDGGYYVPSMGLYMAPGADCIDQWEQVVAVPVDVVRRLQEVLAHPGAMKDVEPLFGAALINQLLALRVPVAVIGGTEGQP
ncbi:hypothetical protein [Actinomyces faecalis]|uniref:hypothetical protein n=1 Tax=Actinomyces faecalis TaxID=2722820 RepID=UPI0015537F8F|nr:hypothetical protein [Actinomyces faecalis]